MEDVLGELFQESLLAMDAIEARGEATAGNRGDDVHLVEQRAAGGDEAGLREGLHDPVAQRRGPRAAAREGQDHERAVRVSLAAAELGKAVAFLFVPGLERGVLGEGRAGREGQREDGNGQSGKVAANHG